MTDSMIKQILAGTVAEGSTVTIKGWIRTRRDSKGGFSFLSISDGTCFSPLQVIADETLSNYADEILHLTTGCSVIATGKLVQSQGKGQSYEIQASKLALVGSVQDP
ncbi:MAG: asparagine--tRNA ligase, partial [Gammaproteobacteria bacterium]|nr:asparagine--tRNA ligase [Gammaproteobacteria bacterium]